ncbi:hypothetical protein MC885_020692 [Smutsia gigantea]|nr:hypothetical protein MC885_020692 [Smutsia gigantea]
MVKTRQVLLAALWLQLSWVSGKNEVEQSPPYLSAQEGDYITINCSYRIGMTILKWLQQKPRGGIVSLFMMSLEMKTTGRLRATVNTEDRHSSLHITAAQPRDSAVYFCAETQCSPAPGARTQTLKLKSILSPHSCLSRLVCLIRQVT